MTTTSKTGIKINFKGVSGNAFALLGVCYRELKRNGKADLWKKFQKQATAGDYNNLLCTIDDWFDVTFEDEEAEDED